MSPAPKELLCSSGCSPAGSTSRSRAAPSPATGSACIAGRKRAVLQTPAPWQLPQP